MFKYESHLGADSPCRITQGVDLHDHDVPPSRVAWEAAAGQDWRQLQVAVGVTGGPGSEREGATVTVIDTDELAKRNARFADGGSFADLKLMPSGSLTVIGCVDPRVDPSDVFGLKPGEAAVIRNVGGRVTPTTLRTLEMLSKVVQARTGGPRPGDVHYAVLHHTDCGITDLTAFPELLADYFGVPAGDLDAKAVTDPVAAVRVDAEILKQRLPAGVFVSGLVYDVATGLIDVVVPPARVEA
ncbi:carbonic anhydrase [Streptomyces griseochromogenes]|uniref:carbonic anhydrase n=1 Tax=Streptomyces griseochromogenes TaxID=68214 RepID=UPI0037923DE2